MQKKNKKPPDGQIRRKKCGESLRETIIMKPVTPPLAHLGSTDLCKWASQFCCMKLSPTLHNSQNINEDFATPGLPKFILNGVVKMSELRGFLFFIVCFVKWKVRVIFFSDCINFQSYVFCIRRLQHEKRQSYIVRFDAVMNIFVDNIVFLFFSINTYYSMRYHEHEFFHFTCFYKLASVEK